MYISINVLSNYFTLQSAEIISSIQCKTSDRTNMKMILKIQNMFFGMTPTCAKNIWLRRPFQMENIYVMQQNLPSKDIRS